MSGKKYTYDEALSASIKYFGGDELAAGVFVSKYALTDGATEYYELTPKDMHRRLAREFARIEEKYPNPMSEDDIFWLLDGFKYVVPAGSPMSGIGNTNQVQSLGNCFRAGTKIITISGIKNIEDVKIGDMVPTHKGNIKPVLQTHKNKLNDRQMFKIKCLRTPNIFVTGNHNFWSISQEQLEWGECPQWNPVEYLRKGDWIAIPNYNGGADSDDIDIAVDIFNKPVDAPVVYEKEVTKDTFQLFSCWNAGKSSAKCRKKHNIINRNWHIDEDFAFFLGLWYGDGCVFSPGHFSKKLKGITFTFGSHEKKLVRFVSKYGEKLLGIKPDINWNTDIDGSVQIVFNSPAAAYTFAEIFGRGCRGKKIPNRCFLWSKKLIDSLICGLVSSDGVVTKEGDVRVTLTNKNVIRYIYMLARMHGVPLGYSETSYCARLDFPKRSNYIKYVSKAYNDNRIKNSVKRAETTFQLKVIDGVTFVKIQQKEKVPAKKNEFVYTLGVKDDHSYCVEGVICQNCFVLDPPADSYGGILRTDQELVQLMKRRGGVGISISNIRPKGMPTKNAAKTTDGIAVFMERFSNSCLEVAQSARRGAELIALSVHHPEIEMFINIKRDDESKVTGANLSVLLTDEFMQAVRDDKEYEQRWPVDSETSTISKKVKARIVWNQIIESAWKRAEPGLLFIDTIRNNSPADIYGSVDKNFYSTASNPCGELVMGTDSCRLTSINLKSFVKNPFAKHAVFDFELFGRVTEMSQRLMDDLIDLELEKIDAIIAKVMSDPEPLETKQIELSLWQKMKDNCIKGRRTGLGITGLADVFATLGMRYGSNESIELTDKIYKALAIHAYRSSCTMAGERGSFPIFNRKLEEGHVFLSKIWEADHTVAELYNKNGRRNIALTTTPPAGSLSLLTQTSSGIEPVFMLEYERWRKISDSMPDTKIDRVDANGIAWQKYLVAHQGFQQWKSLTGLSDVELSPYYKSTALEIDWKAAVKLQSTATSWICHAISKTTNIPKDSPKELVADIYIAAWESGCKGFTVYRDGCRDGVLTKKGEGNKEDRIKELERTNSDLMSELDKRKAMPVSVAPKRPDILESRTHKLKLDFGDSNLRNTYVTVSFFPGSKRPYEMFVQAPSSGLDEKDMQILELTARTTSMNLRHGLPIQHICEQLDKIGGQYIFSIPTTIARVLKLYVDETEEEPVRPELEQPELELPGGLMKCPKCGEKSYRPIGQTCGICYQCDFSGCG